MNISIGEKKVFGGAAPRYKRLEDYHRCRGMTGGIRARCARDKVQVWEHLEACDSGKGTCR